ncbi:MAG: Nif3-like dinuclear metal center hexameric protein [Thiomicrorhabdus chilensis]|uniref:Nif3-like dinuclear metal center hexameric protein n=1 Tax=Thiomicrorhabdus chilensis TaxID=63656 RepID=UPI00299D25AB|nr:Nif3-like dinuclear metal center hexameric protein [Thiomicrorhabdus chilensis]MDX1347368.1 Nif3-like dinuclear metal center hexameric protein [Thiomicrorhabdus chilensis]
MLRSELSDYLHDFLKVADFQDYAPNGLQVEGRTEIRTIVTGVTACQALIDKAIELKADAVLVHHGYFWKSEPVEIIGFKQKRIKSLLTHDINLFGYHLPLDAHPLLGNNAMLAKLWGLQDITPQAGLVRLGNLPEPSSITDFRNQVSESLGREVLHLPGGPDKINTVAWCSGGAQNYIDIALKWEADLFISGEVSEQTTHIAKEGGIHYFAAGHHATERLGIQALGEHLAEKFGLRCHFVDVPNPV